MPRLSASLLAILLAAPAWGVEIKKAAIPAVPAIPSGAALAPKIVGPASALGAPAAIAQAPAIPSFALRPLASLIPQEFAAPGPQLAAPLPLVRGNAVESGRYVVEAARPGSRVTAESASGSVFDGLAGQRAGAATFVAETAGLSGRVLLEELHRQSGRGYRPRSYDEAKAFLFKSADQVIVNGKHGIIDAYSGVFVEGTGDDGSGYPEDGDDNQDGHVDRDGMNVEHIWPQSFFDKRPPMRSDLHHLMATFIHPNGVRGHLPFGVVRGRGDYWNEAGAKRGQGVFEPPDFTKGRVARAMLYFYTRHYDKNISNGHYNDAFWNDKLALFLDWNRRFPPDDFERHRNDVVEAYQGNRNPFVDDPALAERVGVEGFRKPSRSARGLSLRVPRRLATAATGR